MEWIIDSFARVDPPDGVGVSPYKEFDNDRSNEVNLLKLLRLPPRIKVLEACGAIADGRIEVVTENYAKVFSSRRDKVYTVYLDLNKGLVYSNDNGTLLRGYVGYPIICFMMVKRALPYDDRIAKALAGIPWADLNERYKKYAIVESIVKKIARERGVSEGEIDRFVNEVLRDLARYRLYLVSTIPQQ